MSNYIFKPSAQTASFGPTVWVEFSPLAAKYKAINLGQGFPDFEPPSFVSEASIKTTESGGFNQYARSAGHLRLVNAISTVYSPLFGRTLDPMTEIMVSVGASEGLFVAIQTIVNKGDEVILIEPFFDIYTGAVTMAGGQAKCISLREYKEDRKPGEQRSSRHWKLDWSELESAITDKTRLIILNNPHNPTGKVWSREELLKFSEIVQKHPHLTVISDEVYEWMTYDDAVHTRIATLPGMYERTITIGSSGKTFSITGWKVGWIIGPRAIVSAISMSHQYVPFSVSTPHQEAVAIALEQVEQRNYFHELRTMYQAKRDKLVGGLRAAGLDPVVPEGTYFVMGDTSNIKLSGDQGQNTSLTGMGLNLRDWNVCRWLTTDIGVASIPPSAFYSEEHAKEGFNYARFCFCKKDEVLDRANQSLLKLKDHNNNNQK
ncbi:kynurenine-oxoglutarate transaminase [Heterostelium album PN500]|uniref:kynurenine--oxoglutarate transaminase n=1 Tax=Heterostelium pallidum (strain ATCC 26659 / Pp 5 / PN500) TaxID=670386 RepID=D3AWX8_HETP5|nr:kynurenine-oxoglutarate transaminase [Heterostelium album PN500]EFA86801.1 kynurenine-oxoglutarate transaminase [Heterostelium album PN500]|eukprot:XP_020438904.1 kynurenine-oxoglutarate transaminase [Heterostelium album PN500]